MFLPIPDKEKSRLALGLSFLSDASHRAATDYVLGGVCGSVCVINFRERDISKTNFWILAQFVAGT